MNATKDTLTFAALFALPMWLAYFVAASAATVSVDFTLIPYFLETLVLFMWAVGVLFFYDGINKNLKLPTIRCLELFEDFKTRLAKDGLTADWNPNESTHRITIDGLIPDVLLTPESQRPAFTKAVQGPDLEIGDETFDRLLYIRGDEVAIISRLDDSVRELLMTLFAPISEQVELENGEIRTYHHDWELHIEDGTLSFPAKRLEEVLERKDLEQVVQLALAFSNQRSDTSGERLLELLRNDPNHQIRGRAFGLLLQQVDRFELDLDALLFELIRGSKLNEFPLTEAEVCERLDTCTAEEHTVLLMACGVWLRANATEKESIESLTFAFEAAQDGPTSRLLGEALANLRSRLGELAGSLAVIGNEGKGKLTLTTEGGETSIAEPDEQRKQLAAKAKDRQPS